ncbi:unnamed protein product [Ambrosiozyma monospora]|uniref:Unnamed protein product n=1 Tax=Ambrosiozyma monospora TaxID=43982 RepID=A0A9W6Z264_AMBMO|nr:unnamed protein product [Ambrosiozyma monospora]
MTSGSIASINFLTVFKAIGAGGNGLTNPSSKQMALMPPFRLTNQLISKTNNNTLGQQLMGQELISVPNKTPLNLNFYVMGQ